LARESFFDELARGLAEGSVTRGKALRLMGAALLGGTLASLGIGEAAADDLCKPTVKKCRKDKQCVAPTALIARAPLVRLGRCCVTKAVSLTTAEQ
jgi:hypothetical protein